MDELDVLQIMIGINIALLVLATLIAVVGICGDTYAKCEKELKNRITLRGWVAIGLLLASIGLGAYKEFLQQEQEDQISAYNEELLQKIEDQGTVIDGLESKLAETISDQTSVLSKQLNANFSAEIFQGYWSSEGIWDVVPEGKKVRYNARSMTINFSHVVGNQFFAEVNDNYRNGLKGTMIGEATAEVTIGQNNRGILKMNGIGGNRMLELNMTEFDFWGDENLNPKTILQPTTK